MMLVSESLGAMAAGEGRGFGGMYGADVFGEAAFLCEAFIAHCARKGGRGGRVNGLDVPGEVAFPSEAFAADFMRAGEDWRVG